MSNFYEDASVVMVPSGYKTSKVYSSVPDDGSADLTFSRSNDTATRVGPDGLIEKVRTNYLLQSNTFSDAAWIQTDVTPTSGQSGYDGSNDAWELNATTSNGNLVQALSFSGLNTLSFYAKQGSLQYVFILFNGAGFNGTASVDLADGSIYNASVYLEDIKTTDVGGGWYRIEAVSNRGNSDIRIYPSNNTSGGTTAAGTIYIQDAQLETGDVATDYIETTTSAVSVGPLANIPRLDYSGGANSPSLLLEPQRTNAITFSESFDNAAWNKEDLSVTANATVSPDGYTNADLLVPNATSTDHSIYQNTSSGAAKTYSVFAKAGGYNYIFVGSNNNVATDGVFFNLTNGTISQNTSSLTASIVSYGNGWYRCIVTASSWPTTYAIICPSSNGTSFDFAGDGTSGVYAWGAQLEAGAYATSYIPTLSAAVTRGADFMYRSSLGSAVFGTTDGVVFLETGTCHNNSDTSATKDFISVEKDGSNWFAIGSGGTDSAPTIRFATRIAGVVTTEAEPLGLSNSKIAIKYSASNFKIFVNGSLEATIAKSIGNYQDVYFMVNSADDLSMPLKQFLVFPSVLTDAECITLTA